MIDPERGSGPWLASTILALALFLGVVKLYRDQTRAVDPIPSVDGIVVCSRASGRCTFYPWGGHMVDTTDDAVVFVPQAWYTEQRAEIDSMIRAGAAPAPKE